MSKITDDKSFMSFKDLYYSETFIPLAELPHTPKKQIKKTAKPKFTNRGFFTETLAEIHESYSRHLVNERSSWYEAIECGHLKPVIDQDGNVKLLSKASLNSQHAEWCEQIEKIASQWIERENYHSSQDSGIDSINSIMQALEQLTRYLPELEQKQPNYFLDSETYKIGVTLQSEGTLTLLIGQNSEVEYSYAQRQEKGTVRISGIAKLTTNIKNSKNIWKLLNLQGIVK